QSGLSSLKVIYYSAQLFRFKISPRYVVRYIPATCGGFLSPATNATRDKAPATLRLTGTLPA
ncbi:hypothetical protein UQ90_16030, partial [Shigella dysenteriae]